MDGSPKITAHATPPAQNGQTKNEGGGDNRATDSENAGPERNEMAVTRKRSRSGNRISRPLVKGNNDKHRGTNDPDGTEVEKAWLRDCVRGDSLHYYALHRQDLRVMATVENQRRERLLNLKLRGIKVDEDRERDKLDKIGGYDPDRSLKDPADVYGPGYGQYGTIPNRPPTRDFHKGVIYPGGRPRVGGRRATELRILRRDLKRHAEQMEELVPIRIDLEWDKLRLRDTFTWNLHDRVVPVHVFAEQLVEDFGLSLDSCRGLVQKVVASMEEQIQDHMPHAFIDDGPDDPHLPYTAYKDDEMRITIKLNITIGQHTLVDQFEWDLNNAGDGPELFALQMAKDLSLSGEFATAIAHDIREQSQLFTRSLYIVGHPFDGRPVADQDLLAGMSPSPMPSSFRPYQATKEFMPYLYELNETDLERTEHSLSRDERRQKRSTNRRGGPALPDLKDRRRTIRTLVLSSIIPGAAETMEDSRIVQPSKTTTNKAKRPGYRDRDSFDGSENSESEESSHSDAELPTALFSGTARTRGMRGAATAAQAAIKGSSLRSATPESLPIHHHETRTGRRRDYREESVDENTPSLIVKLRIGPRLKQFLRDLKTKPRNNVQDSPHRRSQSGTPGQATPKPGTMGPPSTPGQQHAQQRGSPPHHRDVNPLHPHAAQIGRVDAVAPPSVDNPPVFLSSSSVPTLPSQSTFRHMPLKPIC